MSAVRSLEAPAASLHPLKARLTPGRSTDPPDRAAGLRTIRVGLVGLGQVGQAVARLAHDTARLTQHGLRFRVLGALVRDVTRPRQCPRPPRLTTNPAAFLRGHYDVVIEALATVEPARAIVARLLGRGIPVVTANKALVAAHGAALSALAARRGTSFRYEASALAGVPFLGALSARPLVSDVERFAAVVNGTSNFILSTLEAEQGGFDQAVAAAQARGLTEPDPSRDLDGLDAADKLSLLAALFGWGAVPAALVDVQGIRDLTPADLGVARSLGATIKPVVWAERTALGVNAFIGPALVPARHPLASLGGTLSGIQLSGRFVSDLFFSGPGAGPEITAATILDDAVEAASSQPTRPRRVRSAARCPAIDAPATRWLLRARFPGLVPDAPAIRTAVTNLGLDVRRVTDADGDTRWIQIGRASREDVTRATGHLRDTHRVQCLSLREIE